MDICILKFEQAGFKKIRKDTVRWQSDTGFYGWVGLNQGLHKDFLRINPFFGIHCEQIERFCCKMEGRKYNRAVATIALHMGEVAPEEDTIVFTRNEAIEPEAQRLVDLYITYAVPFYNTHQSYEKLLPYLLEKVDILGGYPESVASAYFLMGQPEKAKQFTEDFLKLEEEYFIDFAKPFLDCLRLVSR